MAQLGEPVSPPDFFVDAVHSKDTCPWHDDSLQPTEPPEMDLQADDDDSMQGEAIAPMAANSGKKLGANLEGGDDTKIDVLYPGASAAKEEVLQWAPHHLIPGNASLKGSRIVPYLGDSKVIAKYGGGSKIKDTQTVGYDVNSGPNGVWLPSPYALSMKSKWPTNPDSKLAYVTAAIDQNGGNCQFHMSHSKYSEKVTEVLNSLAAKLVLLTRSGVCENAKADSDGKFDAPKGLLGKLNGLSGQLRRYVTGPVWRDPLFTDDTLMAGYRAHRGMSKIQGLRGDIAATPVSTS